MTPTVVMTGSRDAFVDALHARFLRSGWTVVDVPVDAPMDEAATRAAEQVERVDILLADIRVDIDAGAIGSLDFNKLLQAHEANGLATMKFIEAFLPLTEGGLKRVCFLTSEDALIGDRKAGAAGIAVRMSASSTHMAAAIIANNLRRDAYSVRLYIPDRTADGASTAFDYLTSDVDDTRLVVVDHLGNTRSY